MEDTVVSCCTVWFAKPLEMDNFTLTQETDDVVYIGIVREAENIVIGDAGFLLCRQIFRQIGNDVAGDLHGGGGPGIAGGKLGKHASGVIHKVGIKAGGSDLLLAEVPGQLVDQGAYHFQMPQFLSTY